MAEETDDEIAVLFLPRDTGECYDMPEADKVVKVTGMGKATHMAANAHRFTVEGEAPNSAFTKLMAVFHFVLMNTKADDGNIFLHHLNRCDCKDVKIIEETPSGKKGGEWMEETDDNGNAVVGVGNLLEEMDAEYCKRSVDIPVIQNILIAIIIITTIFLFKFDQEYIGSAAGKLIDLLNESGCAALLKKLEVDYTKRKYLEKLTRVLVHAVAMKARWELAIAECPVRVCRGRLTGMGSGNAKMDVIIAVYQRTTIDPVLKCFLSYIWTHGHVGKIRELIEDSKTPAGAVKYCYSARFMASVDFVNLKAVVDKFDISVLMGCVLYIGVPLADQRAFGNNDFSAPHARAVKDELTKFASASACMQRMAPFAALSAAKITAGTERTAESSSSLESLD